MHADHFEQITRGCTDVTAGVVGDFLRERLNELAVVQERRYKLLISAMPDREKKSIGERAHEAERLATNFLTPEELEDLTQQLTARVLSDLSSCWAGRLLLRPTPIPSQRSIVAGPTPSTGSCG